MSVRPRSSGARRLAAVAAMGTVAAPALWAAPSLAAPSAPSAVAAPADATVVAAVRFLAAQQQPDGGFEVAQAGFETPDVVLALAEAAQTGPTWDTARARAGVEAVRTDTGLDALDHLDDRAAAPDLAPGEAAKYIVDVAAPLGIDPRDFDPQGDTAAPVDLVARMGQGADLDGRFRLPGLFNSVLFVDLAHWAIGCRVPGDLIDLIRSAQQANGSWDFAGDPAGAEIDVDTTGLALVALSRAGVGPADPAVRAGLALLAREHRADGGWEAFGATNPNSTAYAALGVQASGGDPATATWRDAAAPELAGTPYTSPDDWVRANQAADGHITSPSDSFGLNTFGTSQAVQGYRRQWFDSSPASTTTCELPGGRRERWLRAESAELFGRPATLDELEMVADVLGNDVADTDRRHRAVLRTVFFGAPVRSALADDLFRLTFGRRADAAGRAYFADLLRTRSREAVTVGLAASPEFYGRAGGTPEGFVTRLYERLLGRTPAAGEVGYWTGQLDAGASRSMVARAILLSVEGRKAEVRRQYRDVLGRRVDAAGLAYWRDRLRAGTSTETLVVELLASGEFLARVGR